jgi:hypothetical protein
MGWEGGKSQGEAHGRRKVVFVSTTLLLYPPSNLGVAKKQRIELDGVKKRSRKGSGEFLKGAVNGITALALVGGARRGGEGTF